MIESCLYCSEDGLEETDWSLEELSGPLIKTTLGEEVLFRWSEFRSKVMQVTTQRMTKIKMAKPTPNMAAPGKFLSQIERKIAKSLHI